RVRRLDRVDIRVVVAHGASEHPLAVLNREVAALHIPAHVLDRPIGLVEEAVLDHHRRAMADQAVALHLPEPETALAGPALRRLPREALDGPARTHMHLL